jgi:hypothetical protein
MSQGESSSVKLGSSFGIKALIIVFLVAVGHQWYQTEYPDDEEMTIATFSYGISMAAAAIAAFFVGRRYWGSDVFGKTYIALAIAFAFNAAGDALYIYYDWFTEEAPWPSMADVFFLLFYPFAAYHLIKNIKYFRKELSWGPKLGVAAVMVAITSVYAFVYLVDSETGEFDPGIIAGEEFDFYFSLVFVAGSSFIFGLAALGAIIFKDSILGKAWLLLAVGIFFFTLADVWYYYLELTGTYAGDSFVNTLWVLSNAAIVYALYKHRKTI